MTKLSFMLAPWAKQIRALKAIPWSLADDLMVIATGEDHEQIFLHAYATTISYLHCIGARLTTALGRSCGTTGGPTSAPGVLLSHHSGISAAT